MKKRISKIVSVILAAIVLIGVVFLAKILFKGSKNQALSEPPITAYENLQSLGETSEEYPTIEFVDKTVVFNNVRFTVLSQTAAGDKAWIEVYWEPIDSRDWKITKADFIIDEKSYSYGGAQMREGLSHYLDGRACKYIAEGNELKENCDSAFLQDTPYRIDRLIFSGVPDGFLNQKAELIIKEINANPNESNYCKALNIEHIQELMQADFPGIELVCVQENGYNGYHIQENSAFANDENAIEILSQHAQNALVGQIVGIWAFDLSHE